MLNSGWNKLQYAKHSVSKNRVNMERWLKEAQIPFGEGVMFLSAYDMATGACMEAAEYYKRSYENSEAKLRSEHNG